MMGLYTTTAQGEEQRVKRTGPKALALILLALCLLPLTVDAQRKRKQPAPDAHPNPADRVKQAKEDVIKAAQDYKSWLAKLLTLQEADVKTATETLDRRKALLGQGVVSKREIEASEHALADA